MMYCISLAEFGAKTDLVESTMQQDSLIGLWFKVHIIAVYW